MINFTMVKVRFEFNCVSSIESKLNKRLGEYFVGDGKNYAIKSN